MVGGNRYCLGLLGSDGDGRSVSIRIASPRLPCLSPRSPLFSPVPPGTRALDSAPQMAVSPSSTAQIATAAHLREDPTRMMVRCTTPPTPSKKRAPDAVVYSNCRRRCREEGCSDVMESLGQTYSCASGARSVVQLPWGGMGVDSQQAAFCA